MFEFHNISKSYAKAKFKALDNINLEVENGEIFGFLGPNGAGKTTTIKLLCGIINPDSITKKNCFKQDSSECRNSSEIIIDGYRMSKEPLKAKKNISFVPDTPDLFSHLKSFEYLNFIGDMYEIPSDVRQQRVEKYSEIFGIKENLNSRISSFSHGMKQKLFLIASLISDPQNWILDEPMIGLDPEATFNLKMLMKQRASNGKTIFFSTHVMEIAEKICTKIGIIKKGKLIFVGSLEELQNQYGNVGKNLEDIFLSITNIDAGELV